jgi:hypothetical protein
MATSKFRPMATYNAAGAIGNFISQSDGIVFIMNASGLFTSPPFPFGIVTAKIADLQTAETLARTGVIGSAAARDIVYNAVLAYMRSYLTYVQTLADNSVTKVKAIGLIKASGFSLKVDGVRIKAPLSVIPGAASGTVVLNSKAARSKALYNWQIGYLAPPDGPIVWSDLPSSTKSKVTIGSLTLNMRTCFRNRTLTKNGLSGWSDAVTIIPQ